MTIKNEQAIPQRNADCSCGSGIKYKKCCLAKKMTAEAELNNALNQRCVLYNERRRINHAKATSEVLVECGPICVRIDYTAEEIYASAIKAAKDLRLSIDEMNTVIKACVTALEIYKL